MSVRTPPRGRRAELLRAQQRLGRLIAQIRADGEQASFWAEHCRWVPGTGHCPLADTAGCRAQCMFAAMREAEAEKIRRLRQQRRRPSSVSN